MRFVVRVAIGVTVVMGALVQSPSVLAQAWARKALESSPRHQEWVALDAGGGRTLHCFVVFPEKKEKAPVALVIHEIMGLTDWVMSLADQLAEAGCIAIAPDLLSGDAPGGGRTKDFPDVTAAREAVGKLPPARVISDLDLAARHALGQAAANGKLAVAGFCWGGAQTFKYAAHAGKHLAAAFPFYGSGPGEEAAVAPIACPVHGFYAENDARVNATLPATEAAMKAAGKTFEPVTYKGAGHGFMRAGQDPAGSDENRRARAEAWERWKKLLHPLMAP